MEVERNRTKVHSVEDISSLRTVWQLLCGRHAYIGISKNNSLDSGIEHGE